MSTNQNKTLVDRFFNEMCNQRRLNIADQLFSADHVYHDPQTPTGKGPEGMKQVIATYHNAVPDSHWKVYDTILSDDKIVTRWEGSGHQEKELNGIPPTGRAVKVEGIWIHRISDNKIVESWNVWDVLGMLQQLGVVPAMEEATSSHN